MSWWTFDYKEENIFELVEDYKKWIIKENDKQLSAIEICAKNGNKDMVNLLYNEYERLEIELNILNGKNNIFHFLSKTNDIYHLVQYINISSIFTRNFNHIDVLSKCLTLRIVWEWLLYITPVN